MGNHPQIIGIGLTTLDVLLRLKEMPTWDTGARLSDFRLDGGGPVATAMAAAARLGARVGFIGTAGNDEAARIKIRLLEQEGIDLSHMVINDAPDDQVVVVYVHEETGERLFSGVQRVQRGDRFLIHAEELDKNYITAADYLHLDGFHFEAALQAAQWMQTLRKTVVLDISKTSGKVGEHLHLLLPHVDVLISGSGVARALTGKEDIFAAGADILTMGPDIFVQTDGANGCYTVTAGVQFHTPAFATEVIDTTGAGDVFHGAFIVGLLHGWPLRDIVHFSTAVSALKCTQLGGRAGIPTMEETLAFLKKQNMGGHYTLTDTQ
ncbi:MAG: hypothetical protein JXA33_11180 [Anaerolineae bacterium]|nr:hypothetical protein [Anaerolineae bacterium]